MNTQLHSFEKLDMTSRQLIELDSRDSWEYLNDRSYRDSFNGELVGLTLKGPRITNYVLRKLVISHVLSVALFECPNVTDLSPLRGVNTLYLEGCSGVTDVSALGGVHTLYLRDCEKITDVSALGGVDTLSLTGCEKITDVSAICGVPNLTFL